MNVPTKAVTNEKSIQLFGDVLRSKESFHVSNNFFYLIIKPLVVAGKVFLLSFATEGAEIKSSERVLLNNDGKSHFIRFQETKLFNSFSVCNSHE